MSIWSETASQFSEQFDKNASSLVKDTASIEEQVGNWEDWTIHWSAFDKNITSAYQNIDDLRRELSALQDDTLSSQNIFFKPMENATKDARKSLKTVVKILDNLAGSNVEATAADKMLSSVVNVCNALTACIAPVTQLGFPEIPILGDIGELLQMLIQKQKIYSMLPPEIRKQVNDTLNARKKDKNANQYMSELANDFKGTETYNLLYSGYIDIVKIMANLPFLPITILCSAVSVLIDAVSQLFKVVGLGTFNFDTMIKSKGLNFNLNIQDPGFEFEPPGNILEALVKCIPLIMNSLVTLPQMLINGIIENLYLIGGGVMTIGSGALWHSNDFLISAINDTILSNELYIENQKLSGLIGKNNEELENIAYNMGIDNKTEEHSQGYDRTNGGSLGVTALGQRNAAELLNQYNANEEVQKLKDQNKQLQSQIEQNNARMESLTAYSLPDKKSSD